MKEVLAHLVRPLDHIGCGEGEDMTYIGSGKGKPWDSVVDTTPALGPICMTDLMCSV